jgi:ActR/RegA family two-component response regulator
VHLAVSTGNPEVLFVDDEESIRLTLPLLLEPHGFKVTVAKSASEALRLITQRRFDVLIADLNIDREGDGFTVVSAMRSTHPETATFILTGYPAFETALQAIRKQVDGYFTKPSDTDEIVSAINATLNNQRLQPRAAATRLADFIEQNRDQIVERWLMAVKSDPQLANIRISEAERKDHVPRLLRHAIGIMRGQEPFANVGEASRQHGTTRARQGYTLLLLLREAKLLRKVIGSFIQEHLLEIVVSYVVSDMTQMYESLDALLDESVQAFTQAAPQRGDR